MKTVKLIILGASRKFPSYKSGKIAVRKKEFDILSKKSYRIFNDPIVFSVLVPSDRLMNSTWKMSKWVRIPLELKHPLPDKY